MSSSVVLITGALTGIGRAAAVAFAKAGHRVVVSGRKPDAGEALVRELRASGAEAEFVQADVRKEDDIRLSARDFLRLKTAGRSVRSDLGAVIEKPCHLFGFLSRVVGLGGHEGVAFLVRKCTENDLCSELARRMSPRREHFTDVRIKSMHFAQNLPHRTR